MMLVWHQPGEWRTVFDLIPVGIWDRKPELSRSQDFGPKASRAVICVISTMRATCMQSADAHLGTTSTYIGYAALEQFDAHTNSNVEIV
jgi:hypothetical protein